MPKLEATIPDEAAMRRFANRYTTTSAIRLEVASMDSAPKADEWRRLGVDGMDGSESANTLGIKLVKEVIQEYAQARRPSEPSVAHKAFVRHKSEDVNLIAIKWPAPNSGGSDKMPSPYIGYLAKRGKADDRWGISEWSSKLIDVSSWIWEESCRKAVRDARERQEVLTPALNQIFKTVLTMGVINGDQVEHPDPAPTLDDVARADWGPGVVQAFGDFIRWLEQTAEWEPFRFATIMGIQCDHLWPLIARYSAIARDPDMVRTIPGVFAKHITEALQNTSLSRESANVLMIRVVHKTTGDSEQIAGGTTDQLRAFFREAARKGVHLNDGQVQSLRVLAGDATNGGLLDRIATIGDAVNDTETRRILLDDTEFGYRLSDMAGVAQGQLWVDLVAEFERRQLLHFRGVINPVDNEAGRIVEEADEWNMQGVTHEQLLALAASENEGVRKGARRLLLVVGEPKKDNVKQGARRARS